MINTTLLTGPLLLLLILGILVLPATSQSAASIQSVDADSEPLRSQFNAAAGKVRAIFLASPT